MKLSDTSEPRFIPLLSDYGFKALCIVSHDREFLPLRAIEFPKVAVVDMAGFRELPTAN